MKISAIVVGIIGVLSVLSLDADSPMPVIVACICLAYEVFAVCVKWDDLMRKAVQMGWLDFEKGENCE